MIQEGFSEEERLGLTLTGITRVSIRTEEAPKASTYLHLSPCSVGFSIS